MGEKEIRFKAIRAEVISCDPFTDCDIVRIYYHRNDGGKEESLTFTATAGSGKRWLREQMPALPVKHCVFDG